MIKGLNKYVTTFDYFDKTLITLSATSGKISIASFATSIGAPVGIANESFSFAFSITAGIVKKLLKTTRNKKKKHNKIIKIVKLNNIESTIPKALMDNEISHEDIKTINEERNYLELKESIRMMKSQKSDIERRC